MMVSVFFLTIKIGIQYLLSTWTWHDLQSSFKLPTEFFSFEEPVQEDCKSCHLGMGLVAHSHIPIGQIIHLCWNLFRAYGNENPVEAADLIDYIRQISAIHGEVDHLSATLFPAYGFSFPAHIRLEAKVAPPSLCYINQAFFHATVATGQEHFLSSEGPSHEADVGGDPLVSLRTVA